MQPQHNLNENASEMPSFDEKPIGNGPKMEQLSEYPPDFNPEAMEVNSKPQPQPLSKRLHSKVWKIRKQAFQHLLSLVIQNPAAYQQHANDTVKFITDSEAACQERALRVLLKYLESGKAAFKQPKPVIKAALEKCLVVQKGEINSIATEVLLHMADNFQALLISQVLDSMMHKNPKICASTIAFLEVLLHNYGAKKLKQLQEFGKTFTLLSSSVRPIAKQQTINLFNEMIRWMGDATLQFNMHPQVKSQVLKFHKSYTRVPMAIKRGLNEDQKKGKKPITQSIDDEDNDEPQDVLVPYDSRWVDRVLQQSKWKQKKSLLDDFIKKTKVSNMVPRQSAHFITLIKRLLSDNNINLLQCGFRITKNLAKGLKKNFSHPCKAVASCIFSKLRDTKAMIVDEAQETLETIMNCLIIEDLVQDIKDGLKDKAPNMRLETLKFIEKMVTRKDKKMVNAFKNLTSTLVDLNQDGASNVRQKALEVLCKMKSSYGINFFGDKLKKIQGKKLQTIQNYVDPNDSKIDEQPAIDNNFENQRKNLKTCSPPKLQSQASLQIMSKASITSEPLPKVFGLSEFDSPLQNARMSAYQNLLQKSPQTIYGQLVEGFKNKVPMSRQSNPNILKLILSCLKKCSQNGLAVEHIQVALYHDWRKCKSILTQFIQANKLNLSALEYVKNAGLLAGGEGLKSRKNLEAASTIQANLESMKNNLNLISSNANPLKNFYLQLPSLIPKMSSPDPNVRLQAAESAVELVRPVPIGAPNEASDPTSAVTESMSQLLSVLRFRVQDSNEQIANNYIMVVTEMLAKGFLTKFRTPGRLLISSLIQKISNPRLNNLEFFIDEMVACHAAILWQFLPVQLSKQAMCSAVLCVIRKHYESFFKSADQKSYVLPLLSNISKDIEAQKCSQLLDQIIEINGEGILEKVVKETKLSGFNIDNYLKKWNLSAAHPSAADKSKPNISTSVVGGMALSNPASAYSKHDRINNDLENPWPLTPSPTHILKMINLMACMGEPFPILASPTCMTERQLLVVNNLRQELVEDYSDLLAKWIFWRMHIQFQPRNLECIFGLMVRMIGSGLELHESEIVTIMGALISCLSTHKSVYLRQVGRVNSMLNQHPLYKDKAFRFWINSFNDPSSPVDEVLSLIVSSAPDMIPSEMVSLARYPAVVKNKEFNEYLRANYTEKLLTVYGFKLQGGEAIEAKQIISEGLNLEILTEVESRYFVEMFERLSSNELADKLVQETEGIPSDMVMKTHLKIMNSVIMPYLNRQLSFINVYNYFKCLQKVITTANCEPYLLNLVRTLSYFLIDLDELKLENHAEMLKTINKLLLILLEISEPKHILEVLFAIIKQQLKSNSNVKLVLLLPKCMGKVLKNPIFKSQYLRSAENAQCLAYVSHELVEIINNFDIAEEGSLMKSIRNLFNQIMVLYPSSLDILQELTAKYDSPRTLAFITGLIQERTKENTGVPNSESKCENPSNPVFAHNKDVKNIGNLIRNMKPMDGLTSSRKKLDNMAQ